MDVGAVDIQKKVRPGTEQERNKACELDSLYKILGNDNVTKTKTETAPLWIVQNVDNAELEQKWSLPYRQVDEK